MIDKRNLMEKVYAYANNSTDHHTHFGAVITDERGNVVGIGWNKLPGGLNPSLPHRQIAPEKYFYFTHAEVSACIDALKNFNPTMLDTMFVSAIPCAGCMQVIIECGIRRIIVHKQGNDAFDDLANTRWDASTKAAIEMSDEAGIHVEMWQGYVASRAMFCGHFVEFTDTGYTKTLTGWTPQYEKGL